LLDHIRPRVLLGLTATPERADGKSVTEWFDGRIASELRLWQALDEGILAPFQYFGLSDDIDLSHVRWRRGGYEVTDLENLYTGNDARVLKILSALREHGDPLDMCALGFCVSVEHARYMARTFTEAGIAAESVSADSSSDERDGSLRRLRSGEAKVVFAVDLFNEGVDVPEIDTVLFLRPTESATVFLQQLGRGLRRTEGKACLTVFDFIGRQHQKFRFDVRFRAITGGGRADVRRQVESGFPFLPAGCHITLDRVSREIILENIRQAVAGGPKRLAAELKDIGDVSLSEFLRETELDLEDLYRSTSWTYIRRLAGFETSTPGPLEEKLSRRVARLLHVDDPERTSWWSETLSSEQPPEIEELSTRRARLAAMLHFDLWGQTKEPGGLASSFARLWQHPSIRREVVEVLELLEDRARNVAIPVSELSDVPLNVHCRYTRDEILAALGVSSPEKPYPSREGVYFDKENRADAFFVTLQKTDREFSPSTLYKDYAISPRLFHWESQSTTSLDSPTGRRYINHVRDGSRILLFARERTKAPNGESLAYLFLGPATYLNHEGSRPIAITWRLHHLLPGDFFQQASTAAG
ncbi:MAG: DUF3427 domain-containing protein, partial [Actinomycetota bacterium]